MTQTRNATAPGASRRTRRATALPLAVAAAVGSAVLGPAGSAAADTADASATADSQDAAQTRARAGGGDRASRVETRNQAARVPAALRAAGVTYTVRAGDTVSHIALRTGTSSRAIIAANGLHASGFIRAGQQIVIPRSADATGQAASSATSATAAPTTRRYTVRPGDTVSHIALRAGTSVRAVVAANDLDARATVRVGQVLTLPGAGGSQTGAAAGESAAPATGGSYTVRAGDTLGHIALRQGTSVAALRGANPGLDARGTIRVGQSLRLPAAAKKIASTFAGRTYPSDTVAAAQANSEALAARAAPSRERMQHIVVHAARDHGVDPALAQAVAYQESGFSMRAVSPANAVGAMQVIPSSGRWASEMAGRRLDLLDPHDNATAGVLILRALLRAERDRATAIAGYYQGLSSVRRNGMYPDTRRYVANIQTLTARFR